MKKLLFIFLVIVLLTSCQQPTPEPTATMTAPDSTNDHLLLNATVTWE